MPFSKDPTKYKEQIKRLSNAHLGQVAWNKGISHLKGAKNPSWKGDKANYISFHTWLRRNFGKANKCEASLIGAICSNKFKTFQWALLKGKEHQHQRENYIQLCQSCHKRYDWKEETRKKQSQSAKRRYS